MNYNIKLKLVKLSDPLLYDVDIHNETIVAETFFNQNITDELVVKELSVGTVKHIIENQITFIATGHNNYGADITCFIDKVYMLVGEVQCRCNLSPTCVCFDNGECTLICYIPLNPLIIPLLIDFNLIDIICSINITTNSVSISKIYDKLIEFYLRTYYTTHYPTYINLIKEFNILKINKENINQLKLF